MTLTSSSSGSAPTVLADRNIKGQASVSFHTPLRLSAIIEVNVTGCAERITHFSVSPAN
jgi:hypothetical protein